MEDIDSIFDNKRNGANLENKIAKMLRDAWWEVKENQPYEDPNTGKQREIDIIATRTHTVWAKGSFPLENPPTLQMRLFIDCKNLPESLGLYVRMNDNKIGKEVFRQVPAYWKLTQEYHKMNDDIPSNMSFHRYLRADRNTAYKSTANDERQLWMQGVNQVLNAMESPLYKKGGGYSVDYPAIVVNDLGKIAIEREDWTRKIADTNLFFGIDYLTNGRKRHFLIDILGESSVSDFLKELDAEFQFLRETIYTHESLIEHHEKQSQRDGY